MSVRLKLTLLYTGVLGITLAIFGLIIYLTMGRAISSETDRSLSAAAASVVRSIKISRAPFDLRQVILPNVDVFSSPGTYLQVVDADGRLVAKSNNLGPQFLPLSQYTLPKSAAGREFFENVGYGEQTIRTFNYPLILDGQLLGVLQVGRSLSQEGIVLSRLRLMIFIGGLITVLAAGTMGWSLARAAFKPIEKIIETAGSIQRGSDLSKRIDYPGPKDELYALSKTLNGMLERVESLYRRLEEINEAQKKFVADASHELRTPLTTIRGNAELLIRMGESDPNRAEALADIAGEAKRLSTMVANLLYLARADAGVGIETSPVTLADLIDRVESGLKAFAGRKIITEGIEGLPGDIMVNVNPDLIAQCAGILLDNAVKYTPGDGGICLGVKVEAGTAGRDQASAPGSAGPGPPWPGHVAIYVRDTGPGIPVEELGEIFKRFYRGRDTRGKSGSGLGLSIARWIMEKHGGRVEVASTPGEGSVFSLIIPLETKDLSA